MAKIKDKIENRTIQLSNVLVVRPQSFEDIQAIIDTLQSDAIVVRFVCLDAQLTQRFLDFLSGAIYSLDGTVKQISGTDYLFAGKNINVVQPYGVGL